MGKMYEETLAWVIKEILEAGGVDKVKDFLGATRTTLYAVIKHKQKPSADKLFDWAEKFGASLHTPDNTARPATRDIEFIDPKIISAANGVQPPASRDYLAVPLAESPVAAGPGRVNEDQLRGWIIVWRHHESIRFRTDLVAVELGRGETSMTPTLHPGDIVLVDRAERTPDPDGKIMLTCDPDGGCAIKRVSTRKVDGDIELVFYSDNGKEFPPRVHRLARDYGGELAHAIGGRVVWAWSDMTRK